MAISVNRRQSKNTSFSLSYTWSHSIDNGLGAGADNIYYTDPPISVYNGVQSFERGNSPLDQRHRMVATGLFTIPTVTSVNTTAYYANADGTLTPYDPTASGNTLATPGKGYALGGFPDGTNARRGQVSVRYTF